jgi:hypothetical protein
MVNGDAANNNLSCRNLSAIPIKTSASSASASSSTAPTAAAQHLQLNSNTATNSTSLIKKTFKIGFTSVVVLLGSLILYLWKKQKEFYQRIVKYAETANANFAGRDREHVELRFGTRWACNVLKTVPNFRDLSCSDPVDCLSDRVSLRTMMGERVRAGEIWRKLASATE